MKYSSNKYNEIVKQIIDIYCDYNLHIFPMNPFYVCELLCIQLIKYSAYDGEDLMLLLKKSRKGFKAPGRRMIFYNDILSNENTETVIRYTLFHEIKHVVFNDDEDTEENEDLAEFFSRYFMCPIPYLMIIRPKTYIDLIAYFNISKTAAKNAFSNYRNRIDKTGFGIYSHELRLIKNILGSSYNEFDVKCQNGIYYIKK